MVDYLISLYTNQWVLAHPANLLAKRGKRIDVLSVRDKIDGNNVRLLITNAPEPSKLDFFQEVETPSLDNFWTSI